MTKYLNYNRKVNDMTGQVVRNSGDELYVVTEQNYDPMTNKTRLTLEPVPRNND